jgi:hypothetical protein
LTTYRKPRKLPLRRESRTIPIKGKGDDEGKYFRCWHCGFICDSSRDELGDSDSTAGDDHTEYKSLCGTTDEYERLVNKPIELKQLVLGGCIGHYQVMGKLGFDGSTVVTVTHNLKSDVSRGCPFCGTTNYRGDY